MHNVAKKELTFHAATLTAINRNGQVWFAASDIAGSLQYSSAKSITNLYNQNLDEFSPGMSEVIESVTSGNYRARVRIFSLRGAHLLAMFARTSVAKEFHRWVLDILDREGRPRKLSTPSNLKAICPCCGKAASITSSSYITRHRMEIIAHCNQEGCPDQLFKSEITFSHYIEKKESNQTLKGVIHSLSSHQKQTLIRMLSAPV